MDLLTTNAESSPPKRISDIGDVLTQGADVPIVGPLQEQGDGPRGYARHFHRKTVYLRYGGLTVDQRLPPL